MNTFFWRDGSFSGYVKICNMVFMKLHIFCCQLPFNQKIGFSKEKTERLLIILESYENIKLTNYPFFFTIYFILFYIFNFLFFLIFFYLMAKMENCFLQLSISTIHYYCVKSNTLSITPNFNPRTKRYSKVCVVFLKWQNGLFLTLWSNALVNLNTL